MLAGQAVAMHFGAMECFRRAILPDQHPEIASKLRRDGANLARAMTDMLDALDRKRGKGPQVVRVERVVVHEGGQAIVGNVQPAAAPKVGGPGYEIGIATPAHAAISLRRPDPAKYPLRTAGDGERAMPNAWRAVDRRTNGRGAGAYPQGQYDAWVAHEGESPSRRDDPGPESRGKAVGGADMMNRSAPLMRFACPPGLRWHEQPPPVSGII
jgi:hypothetical protein